MAEEEEEEEEAEVERKLLEQGAVEQEGVGRLSLLLHVEN